MPKKNYSLPSDLSCECIHRLLTEKLPEVFVAPSKKILSELANIENGFFHGRIERYRCAGRRRPEREEMENILTGQGIKNEDICGALNINRTTLSHFFQGDSATDLTERIFNRYHKELIGFKHPDINKVYYNGYQDAIVKIRKDVLQELGEYTDPKPFLSDENFCYLWHLLKSISWSRALKSQDKAELDAAIVNIAQQMKRLPPTCEYFTYKTPLELLELHRVWGLWFRLVMYCELDQSVNEFHTE